MPLWRDLGDTPRSLQWGGAHVPSSTRSFSPGRAITFHPASKELETSALECSGDFDELCCRTERVRPLEEATTVSAPPVGFTWPTRDDCHSHQAPSFSVGIRAAQPVLNVFLDSRDFQVYLCRKTFLN